MLYKDEDGLIRYNYPKLVATQEELERIYKLLESF
jgi:hypothetical protein